MRHDQTRHSSLLRDLFSTSIPSVYGLRSILGSTILFLFVVEVFTGILLMTVYSPSTTTAWSSVWYIQTQMSMGWLIRSVHHFASDAMIIILGMYLVQMLLTRICKPPRELLWWIGIILLGLVMAMALTGAILPWDQFGYWGTKVRTNILALTPLIGESFKELLIGGTELGHLTLTRFYTLHIIILPGLILLVILLLAKHHRKEWQTAGSQIEHETHLFDRKSLRNACLWLIVLCGLMLFSNFLHDQSGSSLLSAPADPTTTDYPARPEWYNLFLYQWLKWFTSPTMELIGAIILPGILTLLLLMVPSLHRWLPQRWAAALGLVYAGIILIGIIGLTYASLRDDRNPSDELVQSIQQLQQQGQPISESQKKILQARMFHHQKISANVNALRAIELANQNGIGPAGPLAMLRNDPLTQGPKLFAEHCASCHRFDGHNGLGQTLSEPPDSSDLFGFASRSWIRGLLNNPMDEKYFGLMKRPDGKNAHTRMSKWITRTLEENEDDQDRSALMKNFDAVAAYLEDESLHPGRFAHIKEETQNANESLIIQGRRFFVSTCNECHRYNGEQFGTFMAPEMKGYGSVGWIELMIAEPNHELRYRNTGRGKAQMPVFNDKLSQSQIKLIARWLHSQRTITNF